jgi:hypothetical protein
MEKEMKTVDKICDGCKVNMIEVNANKQFCHSCSIERNRKQAKASAKKTHKCKTCDNQISKKRTYCGALTIKGSCAYRAIMTSQGNLNKKPKNYKEKEESEYFRITRRKRDKSCDGSGLF